MGWGPWLNKRETGRRKQLSSRVPLTLVCFCSCEMTATAGACLPLFSDDEPNPLTLKLKHPFLFKISFVRYLITKRGKQIIYCICLEPLRKPQVVLIKMNWGSRDRRTESGFLLFLFPTLGLQRVNLLF